MPDVVIQKDTSIDLLDTSKSPKPSATSDVPIVETKPDASPAPDEGKTPEAPETQEQPEGQSASDKPKKPAQGVQKRLDELTRQREDEKRARLRSEQLLADAIAALKGATTKPATTDAPGEDDPEPTEPDAKKYTEQEAFNADYRKYLRETARWEGRQEAKRFQGQQREAEQKRTREDAHRKMVDTYQANAAKAREKYPDYDTVVGNPDLPITAVMRDAIAQTTEGPDIAFHLGTNLEEANRIAQLSPHGQLIELGLIAAQFRQKAVPAAITPTTKAPPPIRPLGTQSSAAPQVTSGEPTMEAYAAKRLPQLQAERRPGVKR